MVAPLGQRCQLSTWSRTDATLDHPQTGKALLFLLVNQLSIEAYYGILAYFLNSCMKVSHRFTWFLPISHAGSSPHMRVRKWQMTSWWRSAPGWLSWITEWFLGKVAASHDLYPKLWIPGILGMETCFERLGQRKLLLFTGAMTGRLRRPTSAWVLHSKMTGHRSNLGAEWSGYVSCYHDINDQDPNFKTCGSDICGSCCLEPWPKSIRTGSLLKSKKRSDLSNHQWSPLPWWKLVSLKVNVPRIRL